MSNKVKAPEGFQLVDWVGGHRQVFGRFGIIDLTTLTPARAENLIKKGFKKLAKNETTKASDKSQSAKK